MRPDLGCARGKYSAVEVDAARDRAVHTRSPIFAALFALAEASQGQHASHGTTVIAWSSPSAARRARPLCAESCAQLAQLPMRCACASRHRRAGRAARMQPRERRGTGSMQHVTRSIGDAPAHITRVTAPAGPAAIGLETLTVLFASHPSGRDTTPRRPRLCQLCPGYAG